MHLRHLTCDASVFLGLLRLHPESPPAMMLAAMNDDTRGYEVLALQLDWHGTCSILLQRRDESASLTSSSRSCGHSEVFVHAQSILHSTRTLAHYQ